MIYQFKDSICPYCGNDEVIQGAQEHDNKGIWHTRQWWLDHPDKKPSPEQMNDYRSDPTNWKCSKCKYQFSIKEIDSLIFDKVTEWRKEWLDAGTPITESIGIGIITSRGKYKSKVVG